MDTTVIVYGRSRERGVGQEPPMTWFYHDVDRRFMLSTLIDPWLLYPLITGLSDWRRALTWPQWGRTLGVMIKIKDDVSGELLPDGRITKPPTAGDRDRLDAAVRVATEILTRAGADPGSIFVSPPRGTHPSATVRLGEMVDLSLQTSLPGLFVCDASIFPEALGQPTVITIIAFARRLAEHLRRGLLVRTAKAPERVGGDG